MTDTQQTEVGKADWAGAALFLAVLAATIYMGVTDHWQWLLIIPIGAAIVFGLVKFGWDAATAVEKKAKE